MPEIEAVALKGAETLSPFALFLQADIIVKLVMLGLLAASVWAWAIILSTRARLRKIDRESDKFEKAFWAADDSAAFEVRAAKSELPGARVFAAGMEEWKRSTKPAKFDPEATRVRVYAAVERAVGGEIDRIGDRLNILATIGSVSPFVGLFGTVWGIMRSFTAIAGTQNTSLAVVAPGIAEALFATAIGLFAAIPAVIGYNRLTHGIGRLETRLLAFAGEFHAALSRELDQMGTR